MSKQETRNVEMELLQEKLKNLEAKVTKPKTTEEEFQERVAKYESSKAMRDEEKAKIEKRQMELWQQHPKAKQHEIVLFEAWERRANQVEKSNPEFASKLRRNMKRKVKEINEAYDR